MNTKTMIGCLLTAILSSCMNGVDDFDVLGIKSPVVDESYLYPIGGPDYESELQLKNSGLELLGKKQLDLGKQELTLSDFLEGDGALFPVYPKDLTYFELVPYSSLEQDSIGLHFVSHNVSHYIDSLLGDSEQYHVIEQSWNYRGQYFNTLSLHNENDELVYDNILFNILTVSQLRHDGSRRRLLTRSEGPYYGNGCGGDAVCFWGPDGSLLAEAYLWWEEYGHMQSEPIYGDDGHIIRLHYHYVHDYLDYGCDSCTYTYPDFYRDVYTLRNKRTLIAYYRFEDVSVNNAGRLKYCLWAGPKYLFDEEYQNIDLYFNYPFTDNQYIDLSGSIWTSYSYWNNCFVNGRFISKEITFQDREIDY